MLSDPCNILLSRTDECQVYGFLEMVCIGVEMGLWTLSQWQSYISHLCILHYQFGMPMFLLVNFPTNTCAFRTAQSIISQTQSFQVTVMYCARRLKCDNLGLSNACAFISTVISLYRIGIIRTLTSEPLTATFAVT